MTNNRSKVYLKVPAIQELHYRQKWMKDPKTMSYHAGYDKTTAIIMKTDEKNDNLTF